MRGIGCGHTVLVDHAPTTPLEDRRAGKIRDDDEAGFERLTPMESDARQMGASFDMKFWPVHRPPSWEQFTVSKKGSKEMARRTGSIPLPVSVFFSILACTPNSKWLDTTGQSRTQRQAQEDYAACYKIAGFPTDPSHETKAFNSAVATIQKCMGEHGWKMQTD